MEQQKNKFKFSENLWDGFDLLVKRTDNDLLQSKNILNFFKKKAELEEQHSKKLEKLALKTLMSVDESSSINAISFNASWKKIINSSMMESEQHTLLCTSILNKVCQPLQAMIKDMETKRKKILQDGIKLKQDMKEMVDALKKSQLKYEKANKDLESSRIELKEYREQLQQQQNQQPSDSDLNNINKIERRIQRCEQEEKSCDEDYREQIKATNDFQHLYNTESMPKILNDFEHFVISHSHFSKSYFSSLVAVLQELPSSSQHNYDVVKKSVDMVDNVNDVQEFIRKNLMKKHLTQPFQYEPYIQGKLIKKTVSLTWNTKILSSLTSRSGGGGATGSGANTSNNNLNTYITQKEEPILPTASYKVTLEDLMIKQKESHPSLEVPLVLTLLAHSIALLRGHVTEGVYRIPGVISTIKEARQRIDKADYDLSYIDDVRTSAALLKQWLRDIPTALIPDSLYQSAIDQPSNAINLLKNIPIINQRVLCYLINFLQIFTKFEFVAHSKMGTSNLAMVFAPCIMRCPSTDPNVMLNNVGNERLFVETLIKNIPPPLHTNEFLGLPISMSDAIKDTDDIEELEMDQISDNEEDCNNNNSNSNNQNDSNNITQINRSFDRLSTTITDSPTSSLNTSNDNISNVITATAITSTTFTTTSPTTSPPSSSFTAGSRPNRAPTQSLGWVRVKANATASSSPSSNVTTTSTTTDNNNNNN